LGIVKTVKESLDYFYRVLISSWGWSICRGYYPWQDYPRSGSYCNIYTFIWQWDRDRQRNTLDLMLWYYCNMQVTQLFFYALFKEFFLFFDAFLYLTIIVVSGKEFCLHILIVRDCIFVHSKMKFGKKATSCCWYPL